MSPLGTQRAIAVIIFLSPFIYIPTIYKEVIFIVAGILLFVSTLDLRKNKVAHTPEAVQEATHPHAPIVNS